MSTRAAFLENKQINKYDWLSEKRKLNRNWSFLREFNEWDILEYVGYGYGTAPWVQESLEITVTDNLNYKDKKGSCGFCDQSSVMISFYKIQFFTMISDQLTRFLLTVTSLKKAMTRTVQAVNGITQKATRQK